METSPVEISGYSYGTADVRKSHVSISEVEELKISAGLKSSWIDRLGLVILHLTELTPCYKNAFFI